MKSTRMPAPAAAAEGSLPAHWRSPAILPAVCLVLTGVMVAADSAVALAITLLDGNVVAVTLAAAGLAGGWLVPLIGLGRERWRDRLMVGMGLGVGLLSLIVLGLGSAGMLTRPVAVGLVIVLAVTALLRVAVDLARVLPHRKQEEASQATLPDGRSDKTTDRMRLRREALALNTWHYLWLLICPFLAITVLAATLPPGMLWAEEAGGYDALEYHLAVPKEFYEAGRIFFMPYNVYSNMPANDGMLWLLMMSLRGDAIEAANMCQLANVGLAAMFVAAAWWTGRHYSRQAGVAAGVLAATTPWIAYLAGIAFDEPGMLAFGMLSLGAMLRANRAVRPADVEPDSGDSDPQQTTRNSGRSWVLAAGLLAGFACGFKYTAVPLIAIPIALIALFDSKGWSQRAVKLGVFAVGATLAFSPWLIRNVVNTGNPVFPLAYNVFGAKAGVWDAQLNARWQAAHGMAGSGLHAGASHAWSAVYRTVGDWRFGSALVLLAIGGAILRRDRWTVALLLVLIVQTVVWFSATHLFARFAVVLLLPLIVLAGRLVESTSRRMLAGVAAVVFVIVAGLNLYPLTRLYYYHTRTERGGASLAANGHMNWFVEGKWPGCEYLAIVNSLDAKSHVLLVGEARTFYMRTPREYATVFNRQPLAEAVEKLSPQAADSQPDVSMWSGEQPVISEAAAREVIAWMRQRGITHVLVHWAELERLQRTYGMSRRLSPQLFAELESAGLTRMGGFMLGDGLLPYATLYEVPNE